MGAVEIVAGNRRLATFRQPASRRASGQPVARLRVVTAGCLAATCLATVLVGSWTPTLRPMLQARQQPPL